MEFFALPTHTLEDYCHHYKLRHDLLLSCLVILGYSVQKKVNLLHDLNQEHLLYSTEHYMPFLRSEFPYTPANKHYNAQAQIQPKMVEYMHNENMLPIYKDYRHIVEMLCILISKHVISEIVCNLEEDIDEGEVVKFDSEMIEICQSEAQKIAIHAIFLIVSQSHFYTKIEMTPELVRKQIYRLMFSGDENQQAINRSMPNKSLLHSLDMNHCLAKLMLEV